MLEENLHICPTELSFGPLVTNHHRLEILYSLSFTYVLFRRLRRFARDFLLYFLNKIADGAVECKQITYSLASKVTGYSVLRRSIILIFLQQFCKLESI